MDDDKYNLILKEINLLGLKTGLILSQADYKKNNNKEIEKMQLNQNDAEYTAGENPQSILKKVFGYEEFRPLQKEIITNVLNRKDTLAIMPTGGGKSLCYQIPALMMKGLTLVISPLISLMEDQVQNLKSFGVEAALLNSSMTYCDYLRTVELLKNGRIKILYISPEKFNTAKMQNLLTEENIKVSCLTIDEAHCVSSWGHDFRPDYLEIGHLKNNFPDAVCLALTATATEQVQKDIASLLNLKSPKIVLAGFDRPNIYLEVKEKTNGLEQLNLFLQEHNKQSGIIYCFSRKQVDKVTLYLKSQGYSAVSYHAGLSDKERSENQKKFIYDQEQICVATLAFGMGINKPDVRFIVHYDMPKSLEQYYQEIGRAGRDGLNANALLLYSASSAKKIKFFLEKENAPQSKFNLLNSMIEYSQTDGCRRKKLLSYFGENFIENKKDKNYRCCDCCSLGYTSSELNGDGIINIAEKLRAWRKEFSAKEKVPPYVIFGDKTLMDIAEKKPLSIEKLLACYGIGRVKAQKYGEQVIKVVKEFYAKKK